jgi:hypothetical protein
LADDIKDAGVILGDAAAAVAEMRNNLREFNQEVIDLSQMFEVVVKRSKDLPENILTSKDLIKEMGKDSAFFEKIQERVLLLGQKQVEMWHEAAIEALHEELDAIEKEVALIEDLDKANQIMREAEVNYLRELEALNETKEQLEVGIEESLTRQLKILERQLKAEKAAKEELFDTKKVLDDMGAKMRHPSQAAEGFLNSLSQMPRRFAKARNEGKSMGDALKETFNIDKIKAYAKFLKNPMVLAIVAVTAALVVLWKLYKNYYEFLDKKVMPAQMDFNKELGNTGATAEKLRGQANAMGVQFELLGHEFGAGAKMVRDFASGMQSVEPFDKSTMLAAENLVGVLGLGGEEAGKFALQFQKQDGNLKKLHQSMVQAEKDATAYGIPVAAVQKDMAQSPELLARFGTAASQEFAKSAVKARTLGLSIKEVNQAFGDQMDTFEGTSEAAAKLNTIFGTQINSMELMMETNPEKRMMMLREELVKQGKSWNDLNAFEKNMISTTMKVDKAQAALILSSEEERKKLDRKAAARKRDEKTQIQWERGIKRIQKTLIAWGAWIDKTMRAVTKFAAELLGFDKPSKMISSITSKLTKGFQGLNKWIDDTRKAWEKGGEGLSAWGKIARFVWVIMRTGVKIIGKGLVMAFKALLWPLEKSIEGWGMLFDLIGQTQWFQDLSDWINTVTNDIEHFFEVGVNWSEVWEGFKITVKEAAMSIAGFIKEWMWEKPKQWIQKLIDFIVENSDKITKFLDPTGLIGKGIGAIKGLFSSEATAEPALAPIPTKTNIPPLAPIPGGAGAGGEMTFKLVVEGDDSALAKSLAVKQVKAARNV